MTMLPGSGTVVGGGPTGGGRIGVVSGGVTGVVSGGVTGVVSGGVVGVVSGGVTGVESGGTIGGVVAVSTGVLPWWFEPLCRNGMKMAGITANGSHDRPPPAAAIGTPGAVDTKSGGPSSATGATGTGGATCGTGMTDVSVGVPCASGARGRTGRHITMVVECTGAAAAGRGTVRLTRRTTGRRGLRATRGAGFGATTRGLLTFGITAATGFFRATGRLTTRRRTTGFFRAGASTGEQMTSESSDAARATGF